MNCPFYKIPLLLFSSKYISAFYVRQRSSNQMKILLLLGRQRGRNFIESGQIGVMRMFSIVRSIRGPLRDKLLQKEPMGVEIRIPSPLNCPILIFYCPHSILFQRQIFRISIDCVIPLCISIWQVASAILTQSTVTESFIRSEQGTLAQSFSDSTNFNRSTSNYIGLKLQIRGEEQSLELPKPKIGTELRLVKQ